MTSKATFSKEAKLLKAVLMQFSKGKTKLFRNNVGLFMTKDGRRVMTGLCKGSSDIIGWTEVEIKPHMVGKRVAVFTALETKAAKGKPTKEQTNFVNTVKEAGGLANIVYTLDDVKKTIDLLT